uniref:Putative ABC-type transport system, involved in lipoprotein release, permease component n=1 Tax=Magnetococcus massalia (strain MO-1) TaxID=451514 RepID=A0A1S7LQD9_MAGMO|nr:Putative ABC-type transport system, involved in lipoprotein release, permease component [Candidatus Magnetococcus massalia]
MAFLHKQLGLIDYTIASLGRRKGRNLGLLMVYSALIFLLASVMLYSHALKSEATAVLADAPEMVIQKMVGGRHDLIPASYLEKLGKIRGVRSKRGRLWGYYYDPSVKANYTLLVPKEGAPELGETVIGAGIARTRGVDVGDALSLTIPNGELFILNVVGILPRDSELVATDLLLVDADTFRTIMDMPEGYYTDLELTIRNPKEVQTIAGKVVNTLLDVRPILREEMLRTYRAIFDWREGLLLVLLLGSILAFAILAWDKAAGLSAEEKREIGILKAIGWETRDVILMKFWEGGLISLSAFLIGYTAAYWHVFAFSGSLFDPILKGWSVLYPQFTLTPVVDGLQLATLFFFTVFPYAAATLVPIWRVAVTDPDSVMR